VRVAPVDGEPDGGALAHGIDGPVVLPGDEPPGEEVLEGRVHQQHRRVAGQDVLLAGGGGGERLGIGAAVARKEVRKKMVGSIIISPNREPPNGGFARDFKMAAHLLSLLEIDF